MNDPVQHAFETEAFLTQRRIVAAALGQSCVMNPHPQIPQDQCHGHKEQPQMRISHTGVDARLSHLSVAGLDAKPLAVALANLVGEHVQDTELMMAGAVLTVLPVVVLFVALQRFYIAGVMSGSLKE